MSLNCSKKQFFLFKEFYWIRYKRSLRKNLLTLTFNFSHIIKKTLSRIIFWKSLIMTLNYWTLKCREIQTVFRLVLQRDTVLQKGTKKHITHRHLMDWYSLIYHKMIVLINMSTIYFFIVRILLLKFSFYLEHRSLSFLSTLYTEVERSRILCILSRFWWRK